MLTSWSFIVLVWDVICFVMAIFAFIISLFISIVICLLLRSVLSVPCVVLGLSFFVFRCMVLVGLIGVDVILRDGYVTISV